MQRVYELLEGNENQYVVLYNLGRVYEELFQYDRAIEAYERYIAESPEDAADRADAQASEDPLQAAVANLRMAEELLASRGARLTDIERELLIPMDALGAIGNVEAVGNPQARMRLLHLPRQLVGADVKAAPALGVTDEAGHGHRTLDHARQDLAFRNVFPSSESE